MKKNLIHRILLVSTALFITTYMAAQSAHTTAPFLITGAKSHSDLLADIKATSGKMYNHFTQTFPQAVLHNVRQEKGETGINATINGNTLRVKYDAKGRFRSSVLTYPSAEINEQVEEQVTMSFPGFSIFGTVLEVTVGNKSATLIMIENKKSWRRVRLTKEGIDVYEEYVKSK